MPESRPLCAADPIKPTHLLSHICPHTGRRVSKVLLQLGSTRPIAEETQPLCTRHYHFFTKATLHPTLPITALVNAKDYAGFTFKPPSPHSTRQCVRVGLHVHVLISRIHLEKIWGKIKLGAFKGFKKTMTKC